MSRTPPGRTRERVWRFVQGRLLAGEPPTVREVQEAVGLASSSAAIYHLDALVEEGRLSKGVGGETRSFRLTSVRSAGAILSAENARSTGAGRRSASPRRNPSRLELARAALDASAHRSLFGVPVAVPILGRVQAGALTSAHQETEGFVSVQSRFSSDELFALRVRGDSMAPDIQAGDVVVVRRQPSADDGDIVVALVGDEATVKKLWRKRGRVELHASNPSYPPIVPSQDPDGDQPLVVLGKVIELRRSLEKAPSVEKLGSPYSDKPGSTRRG